MELSQFERSVLDRIITGDAEEAVLRQQLEKATVRDRWYSGAGVVVSLDLPQGVPKANLARYDLPQKSTFVLKHPDVPMDAMAIAFLKDGVLNNLECVTFSGNWPSDETLFEIVPADWHHG